MTPCAGRGNSAHKRGFGYKTERTPHKFIALK